MTLLIGYIDHNSQIVVADRRLSYGNGIMKDDEAYKMINYVNRKQRYTFTAAYTGLAESGTFKTLEWFMKVLPKTLTSDKDVKLGIDTLTSECSKIIGSLPLSQDQRSLTFLLCGRYNRYGRQPSLYEAIPFLTIISNCADEHGKQISFVSPKFNAYSARLLKRTGHMTVCRGDLASANAKDFLKLRRLIRKNINHKAKVHLAVDYIRSVAGNSKAVGKNILATALLPKGFSEGFEFPEDQNKATRTMPHLVSASGTCLTNFCVKPIRTPR